MYVVGGANADGVLSSAETYDHGADRWAPLASTPIALTATAIGVLPQPNRCDLLDQGGCNVCTACCHIWIHDGVPCDQCVQKQCPGAANLLITAGGIESSATGPPVATVLGLSGGSKWSGEPAMKAPRRGTIQGSFGGERADGRFGFGDGMSRGMIARRAGRPTPASRPLGAS